MSAARSMASTIITVPFTLLVLCRTSVSGPGPSAACQSNACSGLDENDVGRTREWFRRDALQSGVRDVSGVILFVVLVAVLAVVLLVIDKRVRNHPRQVGDLQLVETLPHFRRHLVDLFLRIDRTAKEKFPLRIFRRQDFLPRHGLELQLALVIAENDRRFAEIDRGRLHRAFILAEKAHLTRGTPRVLPGPLR